MTETAASPGLRATATPVLECRDLSCSYRMRGKDILAVASADLVVPPGQIVGICGPSGSGKTTLLRLVMGLVLPTTGDVRWEGKPLWLRGRFGRYVRNPPRLGFVMPIFQDPVGSLDPRWPVWRTVTEPLTARHHGMRLSRRKRRALAREHLERVGLSHIDVEARPRQLSVGQSQRVAIARALVARPALLVSDEPTSALDVTNAAGIIRLLREVSADNLAVLIVSHDLRMLAVVCDKVLEMRDGYLASLSGRELEAGVTKAHGARAAEIADIEPTSM